MDPLVQKLITGTAGGLGTVIHIGAGATASEDYAGTAIGNLWLVEGDPDTAAELLAATAEHHGVHVRQAIVLPEGAEQVTWHRYNLRSMNGPRTADALKGIYPRLRESSAAGGSGVGIKELLAEILGSDLQGRARALVLDVAGQEAALLRALPDDTVRCFEWIAMRCAGPKTATGWTDPQVAASRLAECHFAAQSEPDAADTPWPIRLFRFDANAAARTEREGLRAQLEALATQHTELRSRADWRAQRILELTHERDSLQTKYEQERARVASTEAELAQLRRQLVEASNARAQLEGACDQARKDLEAARTGSESRLAQTEKAHRNEIERLEDELAQLRLRHRMTSEEVIKAEGQIELIKDVLLRQPGL